MVIGGNFCSKSFGNFAANLGYFPIKVAILLGLYEKTRWPATFHFVADPRYFKKHVIFDGRVVKNETTGLPWTIFANHWTAKVSIFDGRVAKI